MKLFCNVAIWMTALLHSHAASKTIEDRVAEYGEVVRTRLAPQFHAAGVPYPPNHVTLIGLKSERRLEVFAAGAEGHFRFICAYPVLAASGLPGPKLRMGDKQVPEGLYRVQALNPNSRFHLSLRLDYPNDFDRARASAEGRANLGGDIMIHGAAVSKGCFAMGDPAAEDLFVLAALTGIENVTVVIAPLDYRTRPVPDPAMGSPAWLKELYEQIRRELTRYPRGAASS